MICDCCKIEEAVIQIVGVGHFCLKCNNETMLKNFERKDDFKYPDNIFIYEKDGSLRQFELQHMILGGIVSWTASELNGGYVIKDISYVGDNIPTVISRLYKKIVATIQSKTIEKSTEHFCSNLLHRDGANYSMKDKGNISIEEDENGVVYFVIDGEEFSPEEFARMLGSHVGFSMQYQIHDASDAVLEKDELLKSVKVGKDNLMIELEQKISLYCDVPNFIPEKQVGCFEDAVKDVIDKLELMYNAFQTDEVEETGDAIIKRLEKIETNDDFFPENIINRISSIINR